MDLPDILFRCCSWQWWWCCLSWKRPGAVGVEFSIARQWGDTVILSISSGIDMVFCFNVEYFLPTIFFIIYQYKSRINWVCKMQQMWNLRSVVMESQWPQQRTIEPAWGGKAFVWQNKNKEDLFIQVSTHDFDPKRIGFTHNSSASQACWNNQHFTCLCSRNNQDQAPQQEQPFECGSCKKQGECENKVYLVLVIQNNMSVHLQVVSELGCKIFWQIEIS